MILFFKAHSLVVQMILREALQKQEGLNVWQLNVYDEEEIYLVATATVYEDQKMAEIKYINVNRDFRGNGVGSKLLEKIVSKFKDKELIVETFRERVNWYQKFGFKVVRENNNIYLLKKESTFDIS